MRLPGQLFLVGSILLLQVTASIHDDKKRLVKMATAGDKGDAQVDSQPVINSVANQNSGSENPLIGKNSAAGQPSRKKGKRLINTSRQRNNQETIGWARNSFFCILGILFGIWLRLYKLQGSSPLPPKIFEPADPVTYGHLSSSISLVLMITFLVIFLCVIMVVILAFNQEPNQEVESSSSAEQATVPPAKSQLATPTPVNSPISSNV